MEIAAVIGLIIFGVLFLISGKLKKMESDKIEKEAEKEPEEETENERTWNKQR